MTPVAVSPDPKAADARGRGAGGSTAAGAGRGFDDVLTSLDDGTVDAAGGMQPSASGIAAPMLALSAALGDSSLITTLADQAAGTGRTSAPSKGAKRDEGGDAAVQNATQATAPFALMGLLSVTAPIETRPSVVGEPTASGTAPDIRSPAVGSTVNGDAEAAIAGTVAKARPGVALLPALAPARTAGAAEGHESQGIAAGSGLPNVSLGEAADATVAVSVSMPSLQSTTPAPPAAAAALVIGSLAARSDATGVKTRPSKPAGLDALAPVTAPEKTDEASIQSVSIATQVAPAATSLHPGRSPLAVPASAPDVGSRDAAGRTSAPAAKADTATQAAATPVHPTIAAIADAVSELADTPAAAAAPVSAPTSPPTLGPARTMVLQLAPADLGTVAVRLHLTGHTLDVALSVSDPKTLGLVSRERYVLASRLDDRGYQLNTLVIQGADSSAPSTAGSHDSSHSGAGASAQGKGDGNTSADSGRRDSSGQTGRETGRRSSGDSARGGDASLDRRGGFFI